MREVTRPDLETVERLIRRGHYNGPLNLTWVGIGGGFDGPNPNNFMEFIRRAPDGSTVTLESVMRNVLPVNVMAMCLGMHTRCGNEDTLYDQHGNKITSAQQVEQLVRIARELGREVATAGEAREIYRIGVQYNSVDETLAQLGMVPNREPGRRAVPNRYAACPSKPSASIPSRATRGSCSRGRSACSFPIIWRGRF